MRLRLRRTTVACSFVLAACGGEPPPPAAVPTPAASSAASASAAQSAPAPAPVKATAETVTVASPRTTSGGATLTVPAGWKIDSEGPRMRITCPEGDLNVVVLDTPAKSADDAVLAAARALHPDFKRPIHIVEPRPGRNGWDDVRAYEFETSPNEKILVYGRALRHGDTWLAMFIESSQATFEMRVGALALIGDSLRPNGYTKESFAKKTAATLDAAHIKQILDTMEEGRLALDVPGVGISLIQGGKVVYEGGLGVRELGGKTKVDADTLFIIASNTKALSTLLLAKQIDDGKFTWETPVTKVYPDFKLGDEATTRQVLMKHLVCACTGMPRQDLEWLFEFKQATPKSVLGVLGTFQPTTKFGEAFQYSNSMAAAAGFVGGHVAYPQKELGVAYDDAMKSQIFMPLGMTTTTFDSKRAMAGNHATPHSQTIDGVTKVASMRLNDSFMPLRPAGAAWSSPRELARYVQMELGKGKLPNGKTFVSEASILARRAPQATIGESTTYGMGLEVDTKYGIPVVHHGGALVGFYSDMFWLPDQGVGGVIVTNSDTGLELLRPFVREVLETLFDGKPEALQDVLTAAKRHKEAMVKERERLVLPADAVEVKKLAKAYKNASLGELKVTIKGDACTFDVGEWQSIVASRKNDDGSTSYWTIDPGLGGFEFVAGERSGKRVLITRDMQHEYVFEEVP